MKGDRPPVAMARKADDILIAISSMAKKKRSSSLLSMKISKLSKNFTFKTSASQSKFCAFFSFLKNFRKSESSRTKKWQKMINGDIKAVVGYLTTLSKIIEKKKMWFSKLPRKSAINQSKSQSRNNRRKWKSRPLARKVAWTCWPNGSRTP